MSKTPNKSSKTKKTASKITNASLFTWNKWLAVVYALQGVAILLISTVKTFPLTTSYLTADELASEAAGNTVLISATRTLNDVNIVYLIAAFLFIAAIAHASAAWWCRKFYENDLQGSANRIRWIQSAASTSLMLVVVAMLSGIGDLSTLIMIFALSVVMNLFGLLVETHNANKAKSSHLACAISWIAGVTPWVVLAIYLLGACIFGGQVPAYVYWVYASMLVLFGGLAANMWLQLKKKGKWANYLYGERIYLILGLAAMTLLAWQVFFGALRP